MKRFIVGISGASGIIYSIHLLQILNDITDIEIHLVMSQAAKQTLSLETDFSLNKIQELANVTYENDNIAASISSGSYKTMGMVIVPCSIKTLSGIVNSYTDNLVTRAADVVLKERRKLALCIRETPLHIGHICLMKKAIELGAIIMPPIPAFYHRPNSIKEIVDQTVIRILDQFKIDLPQSILTRWHGY